MSPAPAKGPIVTSVREGFTGADLDLLIELAYETLQRRAMHRRAGRAVPDMVGEDRLTRMLHAYRTARGMRDYELSESMTGRT